MTLPDLTALEHTPGYVPATGAFHLTWLLVALPAASAAVLLLGGKRTNAWGHLLGCLAPIASFVLAVALVFQLTSKGDNDRQVDQHLFTWIPVSGFHVDV